MTDATVTKALALLEARKTASRQQLADVALLCYMLRRLGAYGVHEASMQDWVTKESRCVLSDDEDDDEAVDLAKDLGASITKDFKDAVLGSAGDTHHSEMCDALARSNDVWHAFAVALLRTLTMDKRSVRVLCARAVMVARYRDRGEDDSCKRLKREYDPCARLGGMLLARLMELRINE